MGRGWGRLLGGVSCLSEVRERWEVGRRFVRRFWVRKTAPWALVLREVKMSASLVKNWVGWLGVVLVWNGKAGVTLTYLVMC